MAFRLPSSRSALQHALSASRRTPALASALPAARQAQTQATGPSASTSTPASPAAAESEPPASPSKLLSGFAKLLGYNHNSATAIRSTNFYYDHVCNRHSKQDRDFWYGECGLPESFTSWFHITNLHIYLLTVRFRALPSPLGRYFNQQLINHFFIDAEQRLQAHTSQSRIVKNTLKDCLEQYHGSFLAYDEALLVNSDAVLAAALWRNVFGGAWAGAQLSAEGKKAPTGSMDLGMTEADFAKHAQELQALGFKPTPPPAEGAATDEKDPLKVLAQQAQFAVSLEKLVHWVRREIMRLDRLPDQLVAAGRIIDRPSPTMEFTPISIGQPGSKST